MTDQWTLTLDLDEGSLDLRHPLLLGSDPAISGVIDVCNAPQLTGHGLTRLGADHEPLIAAVTVSAERDWSAERGRAVWSWDTDAMERLTASVERRLRATRALDLIERVDDWTDSIMEDVGDRGITGDTSDADLAAMADHDLAEERRAAEVPGAWRIAAHDLHRRYIEYRDHLAAQPPPPLMLGTTETAARLGISAPHLCRRVREGRGPAPARRGYRMQWYADDIEEWIAQRDAS